MKNPFHRKSVRRALTEFAQSLDRDLLDPNSELRQLIARLARSEAKNFYATRLGLALEEFDRLLTERIARAVESLGSAAPSLDQHAADAVALTVDATTPSTLPTCSADKPCDLPGHGGLIDPTKAVNVMDLCPNARFTIPEEG